MWTRWCLAMFLGAALIGAVGGSAWGDVTPERLKALSQSVYSDDSHERVSAVVELTELGEQARPALPALRAALAREREANTKQLMISAIQRIEGGGQGQAVELRPSDLPMAAKKAEEFIKQLGDADARKRGEAARKLKMMGALAEPALDKLRKLAGEGGDDSAQHAAKEAVGEIMLDLWFFAPVSKPQETAERRLGAIVEQLAKKLEDATPTVRIKATRQLMRMEAAAGMALPRLQQMAQKDPDPTARRAAGMATKRIAAAQTINDAWYKAEAELEQKGKGQPAKRN